MESPGCGRPPDRRRLAKDCGRAGRSRHAARCSIQSSNDLTRFINGLNGTGVAFGRRLSSRLLLDLLETTGSWAADLVESLDPKAKALWPVSWAGETESENWMDIGREYTERWHHQMQIRDALGTTRLLEPRWMEPLLDLSVRAFRVTYTGVQAPSGTTVTFDVRGPTTGAWTVLRLEESWRVFRGRPSDPTSLVSIQGDDAWRLLYNAVTPELLSRVVATGDAALAQPMLRTRSVIV